MRLLPDQIPNPFHFMEHFQDQVVRLFMGQVQILHGTELNDDLGSSEPCWRWDGPRQLLESEEPPPTWEHFYRKEVPDREDDEEEEGCKSPVINEEPIPHFDLAQALPKFERQEWSLAQLRYLVVPARWVALPMRTGMWRRTTQTAQEQARYAYSACLNNECMQPWHIVEATLEEHRRRLLVNRSEADILARHKKRKQQVLDLLASAHHPRNTDPRRSSGRGSVYGSRRHQELENQAGLLDSQLAAELARFRRRFDPTKPQSFRPPRNPSTIATINALAQHSLDMAGDCWTPHAFILNDAGKPTDTPRETARIRVTLNGRTHLLRRVLYALHTGETIQENQEVVRTCTTQHCHRPDHQTSITRTEKL